MKKIGIPLITSVIVFLLVNTIPLQSLLKQSRLRVLLTIRVLDDDTFQLFYIPKNKIISEDNSLRKRVNGSPEIQKITFNIPTDALKNIRLDIGQNQAQRPLVINSISFSVGHKSVSYDILELFTPNNYIQYENGELITVIDNEQKFPYDPYLSSKPSLENIIEKLVQSRFLFWKVITAFLALIIALGIFYVLLKHKNQKSFVSRIYIFMFIVVLYSPTIVKLFCIGTATSLVEKRELAERPELKFNKDFPRNFENYYSDNFSLRELLISWSSYLKTRIFRVSSKPELVQIGRDDFLFYNISSYSNSYKYSKQELEDIFISQVNQKEELASRGIKYVLGFWPNKHSIYSDKYPFSMERQVRIANTLSDQIKNYFRNNGIRLFDVTEDLCGLKEINQLYYKLDTHWNEHGAFVAYQSFCNQTFSELGLTPFDIDTFNVTYKKTYSGDLINMLGLSNNSIYSEDMPIYTLKNGRNRIKKITQTSLPEKAEIHVNNKCENDKIVLVFHDSFTNALKKFLSLHYRKVVYIWAYPIESHKMDKALIVNQVKPDIIINSCVERYLPNLLLR